MRPGASPAGRLLGAKVLVMHGSRRYFLRSSLALVSAAAALRRPMLAAHEKLHIGVPDWTLQLGADPDAIALAARICFQGVQISFGRKLVNDKLPLDDPELLNRYLALAKEHNIVIDGTC